MKWGGNKNYIRVPCISLILLLFHLNTFGTNLFTDTLFFDTNQKTAHLKRFMHVISSKDDLKPHEVIGLAENESRQLTQIEHNAYIWAFFTIEKADSLQQLVLEINNPALQHYVLYRLKNNGPEWRMLSEGGEKYPFNHRHWKHRNFIMRIDQETNSAETYVLKVDDRKRATNFSVLIWDERAFVAHDKRLDFFHSLYFAALLFIGLMSLSIGIIIRSGVFISYGIYATLMFVFMLMILGLAYEFIYPNLPKVQEYSAIFLIVIVLNSFVHFTSIFFQIRTQKPAIYRLVQIHTAITILVIVIWIISGARWDVFYYVKMNYVLIAGMFVVVWSMIIASFRMQKAKASLFGLAFFILGLGGILFALIDAGVLPAERFPTNTLTLTSAIEMSIFTVAVIFEVKSISQEKNRLLIQNAESKQQMLKAFVNGAERERVYLSRELHDNIGSRMALIKNKVFTKDPFDNELNTEVNALFQDIRSMSHELSPGDFSVISLKEYLKDYFIHFEQSTGIQITGILLYFEHFSEILSTQIFRVIQEALQNILKHSYAKRVEIQLIKHSNLIVLTIDDDGVGFDVEQVNYQSSYGLKSIRTRVESLNGIIEISSGKNKGTHIMISIPH